jgi:hypothetical protein
LGWFWPVWHSQDRAAAVVAAPGQVRDMAVGHPEGLIGKVPWAREVPACAAVPAGEDRPNPKRRKGYAPTAAAVRNRGRDPAEVRQWALAEVRHLASGQAPVLAEVADRGSGKAQVGVSVPAEAGQCASDEARHLARAGGVDSAELACGDLAAVEGPVLVPAGGMECLLVEARDLVSAQDADPAVVADRD